MTSFTKFSASCRVNRRWLTALNLVHVNLAVNLANYALELGGLQNKTHSTAICNLLISSIETLHIAALRCLCHCLCFILALYGLWVRIQLIKQQRIRSEKKRFLLKLMTLFSLVTCKFPPNFVTQLQCKMLICTRSVYTKHIFLTD